MVDADRRDAGPLSGTGVWLVVAHVAGDLPHRPRALASSHRGEKDERIRLAHRRVERLEVTDIRVVEERVDEAVQVAVRRQQLRLETRVERNELGHDLADRAARDLHLLGAAGRDAQRRRDADRAHAFPPSQLSKAERLGRIAGARPGWPGRATPSPCPSVRASGVLSPLPVSSATTSSPGRMTPRRRAPATAAKVTPPAVSG